MNFLIPISIVLLSFSFTGFSQSINASENNRLEISARDFYDSKLNGKVSLGEIFKPYESLDSLGEPEEKDHKIIEMVGETLTYSYPGLKLYYEALNQPEFIISAVEISSGAFLELPDGKHLKVGTNIKNYAKITDSLIENSKMKDGVSIDVSGVDVTRIYVKLNELEITELTIYL